MKKWEATMTDPTDDVPETAAAVGGGGDSVSKVLQGMNDISPGKTETESLLLRAPSEHDEVDALPETLRYNNFDLACTLISIVTYLIDVVMDIIVATYFYHLGISHGIYHYWYFGLTITFILLPSLTMTGFSFRWYLMDAENQQLPEVPLWRWVLRLCVLMLQIAPLLRYADSMRNGLLSRWAGNKAAKTSDPEEKKKWSDKRIRFYTLMVYEDADATLLRLFESFLESAPQLVLQVFILIKDPHASQINGSKLLDDAVVDPIIKISILVASVVTSLISLAWSLVVYHRSLRYTYPEKKNLNMLGSLFQFLWHFFSITARVLALSLFAAIYPRWIGPVCAAHWLLMAAWVVFQKTEACNTKCEEMLFALVLGAIYLFSFFNAKEGRTRFKYLIYYSFCFCENTAFIVFWYLFAFDIFDNELWYFYPSIVGHYLMFFGGISFMLLYYAVFHPTGVDVDPKSLFSRREQTAAGRTTTPNFIDLREFASRSASALDQIDGDESATSVRSHKVVRKTSSAPTPFVLPQQSTRTLKAMRGGAVN